MVLFDRPGKKNEALLDASALEAKGDECIRRGDFKAAVTWFDKALDKDPGSTHAYTGKGLAFRNLGKDQESLACYNKVLELLKGQDDLRHKNGMRRKVPGKSREPSTSFDTGLPKDLVSADAWYDKAVTYGSMGDYQKAVDSFDKVLELNPDNADAWYNKGRALGKLRKFIRAVECFDHVLALQPDNADAWYYKGVSLVQLRKIPEAYACFERVLSINPQHQKAVAGMKELTTVLGQMKKK
jgi:tetratricopeptide (TPR) repeat protein